MVNGHFPHLILFLASVKKEVRSMNKKKMSGRQMFLAAETAMVYNEQKRRIHFAATHSIR